MTIRDAYMQAMREHGQSESHIKEAIASSDREFIEIVSQTYKEIPEGQERRLIDEFGKLMKQLDRMSPSEISDLMRGLDERNRKHSANQ